MWYRPVYVYTDRRYSEMRQPDRTQLHAGFGPLRVDTLVVRFPRRKHITIFGAIVVDARFGGSMSPAVRS